MGADFKVKVLDEERAAEFKAMFGTAEVCVKSPVPTMVEIDGEQKLAYMLDIEMLTSEQMDRMVAHIARKFELPEEYVMQNIVRAGLPVLSNNSLVTIENPMRWVDDWPERTEDWDDDEPEPFGLFDDFDENYA